MPAAGTSTHPSQEQPQGDCLPIRVLLADDYADIRDWLKIILQAKGYQVDAEAATGEEAVALALRLKPDLILMDLHMPSLNGLDAAKEILRLLPATHVLILTTHVNPAEVHDGLQIGVRGFAAKT